MIPLSAIARSFLVLAGAVSSLSPMQTVKKTLDDALAIVDRPGTRDEKLIALDQLFGTFLDSDEMCETALGTHRSKLSADQMKEMKKLFRVLFGLTIVSVVRAEYALARGFAEQCVRHADRERDAALQLQAHWALGLCLQLTGDLAPARRHLERIAELFQIGAVRAPEIKLYRLSEAADAHRMSEGRHFRGKLVFNVR